MHMEHAWQRAGGGAPVEQGINRPWAQPHSLIVVKDGLVEVALPRACIAPVADSPANNIS